ncbi:MFS transporter [Colletotrichum tabaci]|uniref:MFS transporter n=1 Tax=Colletotrichum tabaci TaxID=1209068 RepID=A0AAV9TPW3_9PEZI
MARRSAADPTSGNATEAAPLLGTSFEEESLQNASSNRIPDSDDVGGPGQDRLAFRMAAAAWSFVVLGLFVSTIGVTIPHIQDDYRLTDIQVSAIFLVGPVGYCLASSLSNRVHLRFGQRGIAVLGPACHLLYAVTGALHPPFPVFLLATGVGSLGSIASALELLILCLAFRHEDSKRYHSSKGYLAPEASNDKINQREVLKYSATWVYAAYLLADVGTESTVSGWVVAFMLRVRNSSTYASSICSSGFWAGMAVGRVALGVVTDKLGARRAVVLYLALAPVFVILFMFVRVLWVS